MLCYKDTTFCASDCKLSECQRNRAQIPEGVELPIAWADFSDDCPDYTPPPMVA